VTSSDSVAQDQLIDFVRRIESVEDQTKALNSDKSEIYKEAKNQGFDLKVLRKVVADRRKDAGERAEFETIYELYWNAVHGVVRAHVETIEEFPPETADQVHSADDVKPVGVVPVANAGGENVDAHDLDTDNLERAPDLSGADGADRLVLGSDVEAVAPNPKRWTFNDKPHSDCLDPTRCGGFSNLKLCQRCQEAAA
jgi:uncharacterized protein (UPF0335 family)